MVRREPAQPFLVQPQREWEETRRRVDEQAKRTAKILLNNAGLGMDGREIPFKYTSLNIRAKNNYVAALTMVNHEIHKRLGKDRKDCSTEEFKEVLDGIEDILQTLVRRLLKAKSIYDETNS